MSDDLGAHRLVMRVVAEQLLRQRSELAVAVAVHVDLAQLQVR